MGGSDSTCCNSCKPSTQPVDKQITNSRKKADRKKDRRNNASKYDDNNTDYKTPMINTDNTDTRQIGEGAPSILMRSGDTATYKPYMRSSHMTNNYGIYCIFNINHHYM